MDFRHWLLMLGVTVSCGCHIYQTATYNLLNEIEVSRDKKHHRERLTERAEVVWKWTIVAGCTDLAFDEDYHTGFIDGFVDYALDGGQGVPPPVPGPGYRRFTELSPAGIAAIDSWNAGFAAGSAAAYEDTQGRSFLTVPIVGYNPNSRIKTEMEFGTEDASSGVPDGSYNEAVPVPLSTDPPTTDLPKNQLPTLPDVPPSPQPDEPDLSEDPLFMPPQLDPNPNDMPLLPPRLVEPDTGNKLPAVKPPAPLSDKPSLPPVEVEPTVPPPEEDLPMPPIPRIPN